MSVSDYLKTLLKKISHGMTFHVAMIAMIWIQILFSKLICLNTDFAGSHSVLKASGAFQDRSVTIGNVTLEAGFEVL